jgi:hypothetical protein
MATWGTFVDGVPLTAAELNATGTWIDYNPTITQGVNVTVNKQYARYTVVNKWVTVVARIAASSAGTANNIIRVSLPPGYNFASAFGVVGVGRILDVGARYDAVHVECFDADEICFFLSIESTTQNYGQNPNMALANTDEIWFTITYRAA